MPPSVMGDGSPALAGAGSAARPFLRAGIAVQPATPGPAHPGDRSSRFGRTLVPAHHRRASKVPQKKSPGCEPGLGRRKRFSANPNAGTSLDAFSDAVNRRSPAQRRAPQALSRPQRSEDAERRGGEAVPAAQAAPAALGKTAKSQAALTEVIDQETGEIQWFRVDDRRREYVPAKLASHARSDARSRRFQLQSKAKALLSGTLTPRGTRWRTLDCLWTRTSTDVPVFLDQAHGSAHFGNLATCGSVWSCPICAARVSERRRLEIVKASEAHIAAGGRLAMITLTFKHSRQDDLRLLLLRQRKALAWLRAHRDYKSMCDTFGLSGRIRALEVTHGDANGWHPHVHELCFFDGALTRDNARQIRNRIFKLWAEACVRNGLGKPNRVAGVDVSLVDLAKAGTIDAYLTKQGGSWAVDREMVSSQAKKGRKESSSPWQLLEVSSESPRAGKLWLDYASAFFGSQHLVWSRGLKKRFEIDEYSDEELAALQESVAEVVTRLSDDDWRLVTSQPRDVRSIILVLAETGGEDAIRRYLDALASLLCTRPTICEPTPYRTDERPVV